MDCLLKSLVSVIVMPSLEKVLAAASNGLVLPQPASTATSSSVQTMAVKVRFMLDLLFLSLKYDSGSFGRCVRFWLVLVRFRAGLGVAGGDVELFDEL